MSARTSFSADGRCGYGLFVDRTRMHGDAREILNRLKVDVNSVYQKVESLSGGRQQSVAIARAISFDAKGGDFRRADRQPVGDGDPAPARDDARTEESTASPK